MATLTIEVNPDLLERAKQHAASRNTTVEHLMEESLAGIANASNATDLPNRQLLAVRALEDWADAHEFRVDHGSFTREELNERD